MSTSEGMGEGLVGGNCCLEVNMEGLCKVTSQICLASQVWVGHVQGAIAIAWLGLVRD